MGLTVAEKCISRSLIEGEMIRWQRIGIRAHQTLSHDLNGVMSYQAFEAMGLDKVKVEERKEIAVAYNIIEGLPVAHDTAIDVQTADGIVTYRSSEKSATRFFAGYWVIPSSDRTRFSCRLSVSEDIMNLAIKEGYEPKGPFKDKIEAKFTSKQMNAAKNQTK